MQETIVVARRHFMGDGSIPWLFSGRIVGDDEDNTLLILADNESEAEAIFEQFMIKDAGLSEHDVEAKIQGNGACVVLITRQKLI